MIIQKNYLFQSDWFTEQIPWWESCLAKFRGKPNLNFIEIGSFEGRSAIWLLENILTDPSSGITCIDTFEGSPEHKGMSLRWGEIESHFHYNIRESGYEQKVRVIKGCSCDILPKLTLGYYDCIYIDGSHKACDVLEDAVLSKMLLKKGGIIIFDDYEWDDMHDRLDQPKSAIDAFLDIYKEHYSLLFKGKQIIVEFF